MIFTINARIMNKTELTKMRVVRMPRTLTTYKRKNKHRKLVR